MTVSRDHVNMVETTIHAKFFVTIVIIDMASVNYTMDVVVVIWVQNDMGLR